MIALRRRLAAVSGPEPALPWMVLFALFLVDEFDTAATTVLGPTMKDEFDVSESSLILVAIIGLTVILAFSLPVGHLGDRVPRRTITMVGATIAGVCSVFTGLAPTFLLLAVARVGNGVGKLVNESVHPSLLADYYHPTTRPRVFAAHRSAAFVGAILGSASAGLLASVLSWRLAFAVLVVPMALLVAFGVRRLSDPVRGGTDRLIGDVVADVPVPLAVGLVAVDDAPIPFRQAGRELWAVPTLRRLYAAQVFVGAASIPVAIIGPILLDERYGIGELGRGLIGSLYAVAALGGVVWSGRRTPVWMAVDPGRAIDRCGIALAATGVGVALTATTRELAVVVALSMVTSFLGASCFPASAATQALVSPARVRTLSFSLGAMFLVGGVWFLYFLPGIARISDVHGPRWGLFAVAPFFCAAGLVQRSARGLVAADAARVAIGGALERR